MALNFGILQPVNIGGQFMAGRQQAQEQTQRNELAQQQASIREQEMGMRQQEMGMRQQEATERAEDRALKLKKAETRNKFLTDLSAKMEEGGHKLNRQTLSSMMNFGLQSNEDSLVKLASEGLRALDEQDQFQTEMGRFAPAASMTPTAPAVSGALGSGTFDPNAPAPVAPMNALAPASAPVATPVNAMVGGYTRPQIEQMLLSPNTRVRETGKNLLAALPKAAAPAALPVSIAEYERAKIDPAFMTFLQNRAAAQRAPAAAPTPSAPVQVIDPVTNKPVFVSREEALSGRMTPAAAQESLPPKEIQKREASFPQATSAVKGFETKSDSFIRDLIALRDDPGLENITGPIFGRTGSVTREGSRAQALYDKIVAKGGFQALQDMRDASKTGGALGNVSNTEGKQLQASIAAFDRRQNSADVKTAIDQLIGDIEVSKSRMREAYDSTYSYKSGAAPAAATPAAAPAAAPAAGGKLSSTEQAELDALRKRFGK
jgi:hypothetical protein